MDTTQDRPRTTRPIQVHVTQEQRDLLEREIERRRWTFQTLFDEALKHYFESRGETWPTRKTR